MNIILITVPGRGDMRRQALYSMQENSVRWLDHHLTVVMDGAVVCAQDLAHTLIQHKTAQGASAARNTGAASIPLYRRQEIVTFADDDTYFLPGWDSPVPCDTRTVLSGHAHPFNHPHQLPWRADLEFTSVISTVHMVMRWSVWDDVGYFVEPGGPGGGEDVDWCARAVRKGYSLAITKPHRVVHCGLTSSGGKRLAGYDEMMAMNAALVASCGLTGKVVYR